MPDEHRHAHAGGGDLDLRIEDLLRLDRHLPLFLGRAVVHEDVDMGDDVEGDLLGEALALDRIVRSEEHTSELQSLMRISYAVFCLKKKKTHQRLTNQA